MKKTRTDEALAWLNSAPVGEKRTQAQAALLFGISQPTIAGAIARTRTVCPTCAQRVPAGVALMQTERETADPALIGARAELARVVNTYAWHLTDCKARDGTAGAACTCGFAEIERRVNHGR